MPTPPHRPPVAAAAPSTDTNSSLNPTSSSPQSSQSISPVLSYIDSNGAEAYELHQITPTDDDGPDKEEALLHAPDAENEELLPSSRRFSMTSARSYELYTPDEDQAVLKKLDRRLVGFLALLYCLSFLDRSNIGNARIAGLEEELKLSSRQYEWLLKAFYITYIAFEWMTLLYRVVPPHIYISICILSWGIIASTQAIATSFGFLLSLRALLGVGEAAFGPGVPFYLSFFFRRRELAFRTGLFISASPLSASFAGALAWLITKVGEHGPFSPWRLLFLIEGFPSVLVAVWAWDFIPDSPETVKWLTPRQREVAVLRLRREKENEEEGTEQEKYRFRTRNRTGVNFGEVLQTLRDPKCYLTAFMFFSCNVAFSSMPVFLPTIIRDMNHSSLTAQALSAPPYLFSFIIVLITAFYSDRLQSRSMFIMLHSLLATLGYATIAISGYYRSSNTTIRYLALFPAAAGFFSAITIIITWTLNMKESESGRGAGVALMNIIGQCGPLVGTSVFPEEEGPWYVKGMAICAGFMALAGLLAMALRLVLVRENRRNRERSMGGVYTGVPEEEGGSLRERKVFEYML